MIDERDLLEQAARHFEPEPGLSDRIYRRRERKRRNQRVGAGALAIVIALVSFVTLARAFGNGERPAVEPAPQPVGIFSDVSGWIAYGDREGIWAVNPTPGGTPDRIRLSERPGEPLSWSNDGSKLLIRGESSDATPNPFDDRELFVLNADGTETRLTTGFGWGSASISPEGSEVVYSGTSEGPNGHAVSSIFVQDTEGGPSTVLLTAGLRSYPEGTFRTGLGSPTFSPDGARIAYFDGMGDWGNSLRVMNADGSDVRVVLDDQEASISHYDNLAWSPDGSRLAFNGTGGGIWIVAADGSGPAQMDGIGVRWSPSGSLLAFEAGSPSDAGLWVPGGIWLMKADGSGAMQVVTVGYEPMWSADGSRIAYLDEGSLYVADLDGTNVEMLADLGLRRGGEPSLLPLSAFG